MKNYFYKKKIKIPIYRGTLIVVFTNSIEQLDIMVPGSKADSDLYARSIYGKLGPEEIFIVVFNPDNPAFGLSLATFAHEAVHIANMIAEQRGLIPDFQNDEPIAYLTEWVFEQSLDFFRKKFPNKKLK